MVEPTRRTRRWALTGPVGAGKSRVSALLSDLGAGVVDADAEGHLVLQDPVVIEEIVSRFGEAVRADGQIDRAALGRLVFADSTDLGRLNAIMHGRLSRRIAARLALLESGPDQPALAVVEAAVYFLLPPFGPVDLVVTVTAPPELRITRLVESGRFDEETARARVESQSALMADFDRADVILDNSDDPAALERAVADLYRIHVIGAAPGG